MPLDLMTFLQKEITTYPVFLNRDCLSDSSPIHTSRALGNTDKSETKLKNTLHNFARRAHSESDTTLSAKCNFIYD